MSTPGGQRRESLVPLLGSDAPKGPIFAPPDGALCSVSCGMIGEIQVGAPLLFVRSGGGAPARNLPSPCGFPGLRRGIVALASRLLVRSDPALAVVGRN